MNAPPEERVGALTWGLLVAAFIIATCGLVYELIAATAASYLLGDSVTQFSFVIGTYLFAMGVGSWLSRFISGDLLTWFVRVELVVGLVGGLSAWLLFLTFARDGEFRLVLYLLVFGVGAGVGLEIPLLIRILEGRMALKDLVARVLFFDYVGALAASLAFPLLLVPKLGLIASALALGILNALVGGAVVVAFRRDLRNARRLGIECTVVVIGLASVLARGESLQRGVEADLYPHPVLLATSSPYQRLVLTHSPAGETRLHLNGHLQFSSADEHRYHEALVHPAPSAAPRGPLRALVLGGGDGLAIRELLRHPDVKAVTLVDLDPLMTELFSDHEALLALNDEALRDPRVTVVNADAFLWLEGLGEARYEVVVVDFPDPSSYSVGKLYTTTFYRRLAAALAPGGVAVVQSTSPYAARGAFWCVEATLRAVGFTTHPYHVHVPSFGEWGYVLVAREAPTRLREGTPPLRFLNEETLGTLFVFPNDMKPEPGPRPINRLNDQVLVRLYDEEWGHAQ